MKAYGVTCSPCGVSYESRFEWVPLVRIALHDLMSSRARRERHLAAEVETRIRLGIPIDG